MVPAGQTLAAVQGDQLVLEGILGSSREEVLNLKGYISRVGPNDGQDAGQEIILDPKAFIPRYIQARPQGEYLCEVVRETPGKTRVKFHIHLKPREVRSLTLTGADGKTLTLPWSPEAPTRLAPGRYVLDGVAGNGPSGMVQVFLGNIPLKPGQAFSVEDKAEIVLRQSTTFVELGRMAVAALPAPSLAELEDAGQGD